jgi:hypothetical protein
LGTFDFEKNAITLDLEKEFSEEDLETIQKNFETVRKKTPQNYAIFLATPRDPQSTLWTKQNPPKNVPFPISFFVCPSPVLLTYSLLVRTKILKRLQEFARQSEAILRNHLFLAYNPAKFNVLVPPFPFLFLFLFSVCSWTEKKRPW